MNKTIYIIRHGESQGQTGESDDQINPDLSTRGIQQAKRLAPVLSNCKPDLILLSPLQRAWKTCEHAEIRAPLMRFDSRLAETYGADLYEGRSPFKTPDALAEADTRDACRWDRLLRTQHLWDEMKNWREQKIMLFCHWNTASCFFRAFMGIGSENVSCQAVMDNAALTVLELGEIPSLRIWNYNHHVSDLIDYSDNLSFLA